MQKIHSLIDKIHQLPEVLQILLIIGISVTIFLGAIFLHFFLDNWNS